MLAKTGVDAQRLRAKVAAVLEWLKINLRHGWIGNHPTLNAVRLRDDTENGRKRLEAVNAARRRRALHIPYGPRAIHLGLAPPPT